MKFNMEIDINTNVIKSLNEVQKIKLDNHYNISLIKNINNTIALQIGKPLYVSINDKNVGLVKGNIIIGTINKEHIDFIDEYNSGHTKVIKISDESFEPKQPKQTKQPKQKKSKPQQNTKSLSEFI